MHTSRYARRVRTLLLPAILVLGAMGTADVANAYVAKVTAVDLERAGGHLLSAGGGWILNGKLWSCSGGEYCRVVSP